MCIFSNLYVCNYIWILIDGRSLKQRLLDLSLGQLTGDFRQLDPRKLDPSLHCSSKLRKFKRSWVKLIETEAAYSHTSFHGCFPKLRSISNLWSPRRRIAHSLGWVWFLRLGIPPYPNAPCSMLNHLRTFASGDGPAMLMKIPCVIS